MWVAYSRLQSKEQESRRTNEIKYLLTDRIKRNVS